MLYFLPIFIIGLVIIGMLDVESKISREEEESNRQFEEEIKRRLDEIMKEFD